MITKEPPPPAREGHDANRARRAEDDPVESTLEGGRVGIHNTRHKHGNIRAAGMSTHVAGGSAAAERLTQWCTVHAAPRLPLDGLSSVLRTTDGRRSVEVDTTMANS